MAEKNQQQGQDKQIDPQDLDLIDNSLEDEGKDDAALWQEFDQAEGAAPTDPDDDPPADEPAGEDEGEGESAAQGQNPDDSAAPAGDAGEQPEGQQPSGARQEPDIWANATPEQRAAFEAAQANLKKLEQAERSNRGRLSAMQRQINDLMAKGGAASDKGAAKTEGQDQDGNADGFLASDDWKGFQEEYPEVAGPLGKLIGNLQAEITRQSKVLNAIGSERQQAALSEQDQLLSEEHPDWREVIDQAGDAFTAWLDTQPRHIKEAAIRNADGIVDAAEAADVVGRFKAFQSQQGGGNAQEQNSASATGGGKPNNQQLSGKRQRQLESASTARSRGPGAASGIPEDGDPEALWKQFDEMERRQAARG